MPRSVPCPVLTGSRDKLRIRAHDPLICGSSARRKRSPYALFDVLCTATGIRHDPCVLHVFIPAVRFMEGATAHKWWHYTDERKRTLTAQAHSGP